MRTGYRRPRLTSRGRRVAEAVALTAAWGAFALLLALSDFASFAR